MRRIFYTDLLSKNLTISITEKDKIHHMINVMKCKKNEEIFIFNKTYGEWSGKIIEIQKNSIQIFICSQIKPKYEQNFPIIEVAFGLIKGENSSSIIRQSVESGIDIIQPLNTQNVVKKNLNMERTQNQILGSVEQCGRLNIPELRNIVTFEDFVNNKKDNEIIIICDETGKGESFLDIYKEVSQYNKISIVIGPEGGFTTEELGKIKTKIDLGNLIFKADTAAIVAITTLKIMLQLGKQSEN